MFDFLNAALLFLVLFMIIGLPLYIFVHQKRVRQLTIFSKKSSNMAEKQREHIIQEIQHTNKLLETLIKIK